MVLHKFLHLFVIIFEWALFHKSNKKFASTRSFHKKSRILLLSVSLLWWCSPRSAAFSKRNIIKKWKTHSTRIHNTANSSCDCWICYFEIIKYKKQLKIMNFVWKQLSIKMSQGLRVNLHIWLVNPNSEKHLGANESLPRLRSCSQLSYDPIPAKNTFLISNIFCCFFIISNKQQNKWRK